VSIGTKDVPDTSTQVVERKTERSLLVLCNDDSQYSIYLAFDEDAVMHQGITLAPGGPPLVIDNVGELSPLLSNEVNAISQHACGGATLTYLER